MRQVQISEIISAVIGMGMLGVVVFLFYKITNLEKTIEDMKPAMYMYASNNVVAPDELSVDEEFKKSDELFYYLDKSKTSDHETDDKEIKVISKNLAKSIEIIGNNAKDEAQDQKITTAFNKFAEYFANLVHQAPTEDERAIFSTLKAFMEKNQNICKFLKVKKDKLEEIISLAAEDGTKKRTLSSTLNSDEKNVSEELQKIRLYLTLNYLKISIFIDWQDKLTKLIDRSDQSALQKREYQTILKIISNDLMKELQKITKTHRGDEIFKMLDHMKLPGVN